MVIEFINQSMSELLDPTDDSTSGDSYGTVELNERGRLTIPKPLRDALQLDAGTEFTVIREGAAIRLVRELPPLKTLTRGADWGDEAFRDAGAATFGGDDA